MINGECDRLSAHDSNFPLGDDRGDIRCYYIFRAQRTSVRLGQNAAHRHAVECDDLRLVARIVNNICVNACSPEEESTEKDAQNNKKDGLSPVEHPHESCYVCLLYTSDAADDLLCVDLGG